ncbi:MAG: Brp/Blh family beta-carotene 15,15'-dioxygenase [Bacteroidota bacterium]|jgi:Brp/Blh family beta-carotene 15,15'-monooxygenase|nr:Brp/Blh family beta-carotene 15,15'-dioxygenase [Bacteroidota bacterium]
MRTLLIIAGFFLLIFQHLFIATAQHIEFLVFIISIILLGIPHGAADLLVANKNATINHQLFSKFTFLFIYILRLSIFALIIWFSPVIGNLLFILFAAYHFGETDLHQFETNHILGKLFIVSYGLLIISTILLHHFNDVKQIFLLFESGKKYLSLLNWIETNRYAIVITVGIFFLFSTVAFFVKYALYKDLKNGLFLIRLLLILFILYNLPMLLGFTFYFVFWHSFLSLNYIFKYLKNNHVYSNTIIFKQVLLYSVLAILGILIFGVIGFMFTNKDAMAGYIFLGLAVLTVPHMQVMHTMYNNIRTKSRLI